MSNAAAIDALVTGASGFLGKRLVGALENAGQRIFTLDSRSGDIADSATWQTLPPAKTVFHLAGCSYVPHSWENPAEFIRVNTLGTQQALDYCRKHQAHLIFASAYVYGIPEKLPIAETDAPRPNNPYALSKHLAEQLCEFAATYQHTPATIFRIFNIYGPGQREEFLIPSILRYVTQGQPVEIQDLSPRRDYIHVDDVIAAFLKAQAKPAGGIINIGSGMSYSVQEIIAILQAEAKTALPVLCANHVRVQEIPDVVADITRARQLLDWAPRYSLQDGIRQLIATIGKQE